MKSVKGKNIDHVCGAAGKKKKKKKKKNKTNKKKKQKERKRIPICCAKARLLPVGRESGSLGRTAQTTVEIVLVFPIRI